jgi:hemoglobin-like flavoprotein
MTPTEVALVKSTFAMVAPHARQAGLTFYSTLFALDPATRSLFPTEIEPQSKKLMQVLAFAVQNLEHPDTLLPAVRDLGKRHVGYGVVAAQYGSVATALLKTLADALGPEWTPDVEKAWIAAYTVLSTEMKKAAASA